MRSRASPAITATPRRSQDEDGHEEDEQLEGDEAVVDGDDGGVTNVQRVELGHDVSTRNPSTKTARGHHKGASPLTALLNVLQRSRQM